MRITDTALACLAFFPACALAGTASYYVSGTGNDANSGTTATSPFRTVQKAADLTAPGSIVYVMNGVFAPFTVPVSGTSAAPITYVAYPGDTPIIEVPATGYSGISVPPGISYVVIQGFTVSGVSQSVTSAMAQSYYQSLTAPPSNPLYIQWGIAVGGNPGGPVSHHISILANTVSYNSGSGIGVQHSDYITMMGNTVSYNAWWSPQGASGIEIYELTDIDTNTGYKNLIMNNKIYGNAQFVSSWPFGVPSDGEGLIIDDNEDTQNAPYVPYNGRTYIANNVSFDNGSAGIMSYYSQHVDIVNNSTYSNNVVLNRGEVSTLDSNDIWTLNNVLYASSAKASVVNGNSTDSMWDYNIIFGGNSMAFSGPHDLLANPEYVSPSLNPASASFSLAAGSPGLGTGTAYKAPATDINELARPAGSVDRGAYQN